MFFIHRPMNEKYGIINLQILIAFKGQKTFLNVDVNKKALLFNETALNIIRNFIPHKTVTCDDSG